MKKIVCLAVCISVLLAFTINASEVVRIEGSKNREWVSASGQVYVRSARLLSVTTDGRIVTLHKLDGKTSQGRLEQLSEVDQDYVLDAVEAVAGKQVRVELEQLAVERQLESYEKALLRSETEKKLIEDDMIKDESRRRKIVGRLEDQLKINTTQRQIVEEWRRQKALQEKIDREQWDKWRRQLAPGVVMQGGNTLPAGGQVPNRYQPR